MIKDQIDDVQDYIEWVEGNFQKRKLVPYSYQVPKERLIGVCTGEQDLTFPEQPSFN